MNCGNSDTFICMRSFPVHINKSNDTLPVCNKRHKLQWGAHAPTVDTHILGLLNFNEFTPDAYGITTWRMDCINVICRITRSRRWFYDTSFIFYILNCFICSCVSREGDWVPCYAGNPSPALIGAKGVTNIQPSPRINSIHATWAYVKNVGTCPLRTFYARVAMF